MKYTFGCVPDDPAVREAMFKATGVMLEPYKRSIPGTCEACQGKLWIGPIQVAKRDEVAAAGDEVEILCLACAAIGAAGLPPAKVVSLSNKQPGQ